MTPIADINENDEVWSYNEKTKTNIWSTVVQKVNLATQKLYQIVVKNDTVRATSEHPFYTKKGWINANLVTKGMMVLLANGTWNTVQANIPKDTIVPVYNIEVVPAHTFYIGNEQVLVHNGFECFKTKFKNLANASDEFFEDFRGNLSMLEKFDNGELSYPAWQILKKEAAALKTNVEELKLVSKNLDEINGVGGYTKWKKIQSYGKEIADILTKKTKIDDLVQAPAGYEIYTVKNSKYIRRLDKSNVAYPRLAVDENGIVVIYTASTRLSSSSKFVRNLEIFYRKMPLNHQRHHLVPDNVVKNSEIYIEAMSRGLYDVDRAGNGRYLAETAEDFTEISQDFPTHLGSHPNYDLEIGKINNTYLNALISKYGTMDKVPTDVLNKTLDAIETGALKVLEDWKPSRLN